MPDEPKRPRGRPIGSKNQPGAGAVGRPRKDGQPPQSRTPSQNLGTTKRKAAKDAPTGASTDASHGTSGDASTSASRSASTRSSTSPSAPASCGLSNDSGVTNSQSAPTASGPNDKSGISQTHVPFPGHKHDVDLEPGSRVSPLTATSASVIPPPRDSTLLGSGNAVHGGNSEPSVQDGNTAAGPDIAPSDEPAHRAIEANNPYASDLTGDELNPQDDLDVILGHVEPEFEDDEFDELPDDEEDVPASATPQFPTLASLTLLLQIHVKMHHHANASSQSVRRYLNGYQRTTKRFKRGSLLR